MLKKYEINKLDEQRDELSKEVGIDIKKSNTVSLPAGFSRNTSDYGDPVNLRFPLSPSQRLRNASVIFEMQKSEYSEKEQKLIAQRIMNAEINAEVEVTQDLVKTAGLESTVSAKALKAKFKKSKTSEGRLNSIFLQTDEQVILAGVSEGVNVQKNHAPEMFGIKDWNKYADGFKERYGHSIEEVQELVKSVNDKGIHDHKSDPLGRHTHGSSDKLEGAHSHTKENPFGLHIHKKGDRLSGSHVHPMGSLGGHLHDPIMDGPSVYTGTKSDLEKSLLHIQLRKSLDNIAEVIAYCLYKEISELQYLINRWAVRVSEKSRDRNFVQQNLMFSGLLISLKSDLRFLTFEAGRLIDAPSDTEDDTVEIEKNHSSPEARTEVRMTYPCNWDIRSANKARQSLSRLMRINMAFLEIYPEGESFDEFRQKLNSLHDHVEMFIDTWPSYLAKLDALGILTLAPKAEVTNGYGEKNETLDFHGEVPLIKNEEGGEEAAFFNKSDTVAEKNYRQFVEENGLNEQPNYQLHALELSDNEILEKAIGNGKAKKFEGRVLGIVLRPGSPEDRDAQGHWMTAETVRAACYYWAANHTQLGYEHKKYNPQGVAKDPDFRLLQNAIAEQDILLSNGKVIPKGAWYQEWLILNAKYKKMVQQGKLNGFSIKGGGKIIPDKQKK